MSKEISCTTENNTLCSVFSHFINDFKVFAFCYIYNTKWISQSILNLYSEFSQSFHFLNKINHFQVIWNDSKVR